MSAPLAAEPLTAAAFAPFGELLEDKTARQVKIINDNTARRFDELATVDTARAGGRPTLSLFRATPRPQPVVIGMLECHPLGSQAFMPASNAEWLVVVAAGDETPATETLHCFIARGFQGVNYRAGVWHHPLLTLHGGQDFWVLDRAAPAAENAAANLREFHFAPRTIAM